MNRSRALRLAAEKKVEIFELAKRPQRKRTGILAAHEEERKFQALAEKATLAIDRAAKAEADLLQIGLELERYGLKVVMLDGDQPTVVPDDEQFCTRVPVSLSEIYANLGVERDEAVGRANRLQDEMNVLTARLEKSRRLQDKFYEETKTLRQQMEAMIKRRGLHT